MILFVAFALAVVWGLVRGGQLSQLQSLPLHRYGLVLLALGIQFFTIFVPLPIVWGEAVRVPLLALSYAILAVFVWSNRGLPGMWLIGLGLVANWAVMLANGGHMPVTYEAVTAIGKGYLVNSTATGTAVFGSKDILIPSAQTRLGFLADIFVIPPPFPFPSVFSVGDVLIALGMFRLVPYALGKRTYKRLVPNSESI